MCSEKSEQDPEISHDRLATFSALTRSRLKPTTATFLSNLLDRISTLGFPPQHPQSRRYQHAYETDKDKKTVSLTGPDPHWLQDRTKRPVPTAQSGRILRGQHASEWLHDGTGHEDEKDGILQNIKKSTTGLSGAGFSMVNHQLMGVG